MSDPNEPTADPQPVDATKKPRISWVGRDVTVLALFLLL